MTGPDQEFKPFSVLTVETVSKNRRGLIRPLLKTTIRRSFIVCLFVCLFFRDSTNICQKVKGTSQNKREEGPTWLACEQALHLGKSREVTWEQHAKGDASCYQAIAGYTWSQVTAMPPPLTSKLHCEFALLLMSVLIIYFLFMGTVAL